MGGGRGEAPDGDRKPDFGVGEGSEHGKSKKKHHRVTLDKTDATRLSKPTQSHRFVALALPSFLLLTRPVASHHQRITAACSVLATANSSPESAVLPT